MRKIYLFVCVVFVSGELLIQGAFPSNAEEKIKEAQSDLAYVSDYFSFVGRDEKGHVALALDNNRGKDGAGYQAEHFVVMHDEGGGWINLSGNGDYANVDEELFTIPDSESFHFEGVPAKGMVIRSPSNDLALHLEPIPEFLVRSKDESIFRMGAAPAVLNWKGRTISGRVIYEYLYKTDFNRLTRTYFGLWRDFQGFYLSINGKGDFYHHSQQSEKMGELVGRSVGFSVFNGKFDPVEKVDLDVIKRKLTWGFYRWPVKWRIRWEGQKGTGSMTFHLQEKNVIANWVIGGFAMGIVKGEIEYNGQRWPYYGLAELLM